MKKKPKRAVAGTSLVCRTCGCRWKRHADRTLSLYDANQRPCARCDNGGPEELRLEKLTDEALSKRAEILKGRLNAIAAIIEAVDDRCLASDGPVSKTREEITDHELRSIYRHATRHRSLTKKGPAPQ